MIWLPVVGNYVDVDAYASIIAYAELLNQRGKLARTYIPFAPNYSVPAELRMLERENDVWNFNPNDQAIILDISVPEVINRLVPDNQILELIDHHPGYEAYWHSRLGDRAIIERLGAVATSVFEWWGECWDYKKLSPEIAKLLLAAVLDNTLYFNTKNTTERDRKAADMMARIAGTTVAEFAEWYFSETSKAIVGDLKASLVNDCKMVSPSANQSKLAFGQLTIWGAKEIVDRRSEIMDTMSSIGRDWVVSVICISEHKNYIITSSEEYDEFFMNLLGLKKVGEWLVSNRLYLRKEVVGKAQGSPLNSRDFRE